MHDIWLGRVRVLDTAWKDMSAWVGIPAVSKPRNIYLYHPQVYRCAHVFSVTDQLSYIFFANKAQTVIWELVLYTGHALHTSYAQYE